MKKGTLQQKIVAVILALAAIAAVVGGTLAIYTSQVYQRAVVRNRDTEAIRFSSDKLYRVTSGTPLQIYYYPMGKDQTTMSFTVCNYDQSKNTLVNEKDIDYTVDFSILKGTDPFAYTVKYAGGEETADAAGKLALKQLQLPGTLHASHKFTIQLPDNISYENVKINVVVTPNDRALTKNTVLQATLVPIAYATTQGVSVTSTYTDSTRAGTTPLDFDAYNLSVSISGGEGDVLIAWKADRLDIDPFFKAKGKKLEKDQKGNTVLTVHMNSEDETGAYLIQFYNHNSQKPEWKAWDELPIEVKLDNE